MLKMKDTTEVSVSLQTAYFLREKRDYKTELPKNFKKQTDKAP